MRLSVLLPLLLAPASIAAQSMADNDLCNRIGDSRYPDARAQVQQLAQAGGARGSFFAGCLALMADRFSEAAGHFERAVKADDRNAVAHFFLGRAYAEQAQRANVFKQASLAKKTKNEFDRAAQLDPEYLDAREGLAQYYAQAPGIMGGSKDKARAQMEEIRRRNPYRGGMLAAQLANREKQLDVAMREWTQLTTLYPDSLAPWANVAFAHAGQKRWDDAWATVDRLQKAVPGSMWAQYVAGRMAAESGQQLDRGEQSLRRYLGYTPKPGEAPLANAHWRLGTIHERRGQTDAARREYQAALSLDPKLTGAKDALAKLK